MPIVIIVLAVVIVGAVGALYFYRQNAANVNPDQAGIIVEEESAIVASPEAMVPLADGENFTGTMRELITDGRDIICAFSQTDDSGSIMSGTVYVAGGGQKFRGDFSLEQSTEGLIGAHFIRTDGFNYFWSDQLDQGTKVAVDSSAEAIPDDDEIAASQEFMDDKFVYDCRPWAVDGAMFVLPEGMEFVDLSGQVQGVDAVVEDVQENPCAACAELQGPAQDQCRQTLGC